MWVGTDGDGLFLFEGGKFRVFRTGDGLAGNQIRALLYDRQGALWIGTAGGGVSRYANGNFQTFSAAEGLAGNRVYAIHEDETARIGSPRGKG